MKRVVVTLADDGLYVDVFNTDADANEYQEFRKINGRGSELISCKASVGYFVVTEHEDDGANFCSACGKRIKLPSKKLGQ